MGFYSNPLDDMAYAIDGDDGGMDELEELVGIAERIVRLSDAISALQEDFYGIADPLNERFGAGIDTYCLMEQLLNGNYDKEALR